MLNVTSKDLCRETTGGGEAQMLTTHHGFQPCEGGKLHTKNVIYVICLSESRYDKVSPVRCQSAARPEAPQMVDHFSQLSGDFRSRFKVLSSKTHSGVSYDI